MVGDSSSTDSLFKNAPQPSGGGGSSSSSGGIFSSLGAAGGSAIGGPIGGVAGGIGGGFIDSLIFGGQSSAQGDANAQMKAKTIHTMQTSGQQPSIQKHATTSSPPLEPISATLARGAKQIASQAGEATRAVAGKIGNAWLDNKIQGMFRPDPIKQGMRDAQYAHTRYPQTNAWEHLGGSSSPSMGGVTTAKIQAQATRGASRTSAEAPIKKADSEIQKAKAQTGEHKAHTIESLARTKWIPELSIAKADLQTSEASKNSVLYNKALADINHTQKQIATEVQKHGLTKANKEQQQTWARILKPVRNSDDLQKLFLGLATLGLLATGTRGIGAVAGVATKLGRKVKNFVPTKGKITQWPKYGPKAGTTLP